MRRLFCQALHVAVLIQYFNIMLLARQINGTTKPAHFENCTFLLRSDEWIFLGCDTPYLHSKKNCNIDNLFPPPVDTSRGGSVAKQYLSGSSREN